MIGDEEAIEDTIVQLRKNKLNLKVEDNLKDYLSCEITFSEDGKTAWIHQPHLLKKIKDKFGDMVRQLRNYGTPGTPGNSIIRNTGERINLEDQKLYRSGTGMLLYLQKHTRPDMSNTVRELSKVLDGASPAAFKELKRTLKFTIDTENLALRFSPKIEEDKKWRLVAYSDSDWANDKETRISVTGFIIYLLGVPISWKSKSQQGVTLSSSEAEFVALSEAAKEIKFIVQVLLSMGIPVHFPITVRVDNMGAIFMSENVNTSQRTKHIDIRYHFIREFVLDGYIQIIFVRTIDNDADIFTKNLTEELHKRHSTKMLTEKPETK